MNDIRKESSALFMPSGCLTGDALMLYVSGSLKGAALTKAQKHIADCPLCADAADGLRMWLNGNKPDETPTPGSTYTLESEAAILSGKQPAENQSDKSSLNPANKFNARTDILNERIKQRLHTHAIMEANEKKRLSYRPFVWIAAAASVVLLIGGFYVVWIQNQIDSEKLTKQRAAEMAMLESHANPDTLTILLHDKRSALALAEKNVTGTAKTTHTHINEVVEDAEIFNQDELSIASKEAVLPEKLPVEERVTAIKEDSKAVAADKANATPAGNNVKMAATKKAAFENESKDVFTIVEEMPSFPGGEAERNKFLAENITYPQQATENGIQGTVYTSFIVDSNGKIEDAKILRGIGGGCNEEALRVVKLMPRWKPGKQAGKPVRVLFNMPVYFKLQ